LFNFQGTFAIVSAHFGAWPESFFILHRLFPFVKHFFIFFRKFV